MYYVLPVLQAVDEVLKPATDSMMSQCHACPHDHACCQTLVGLTYLEAYDIVTYLKETHQWDQVRDKLRTQRLTIMQLGNFLTDRHRNSEKSVVWQWFIQGKKCALYDEKLHRCRVYEVRPLSCRELFAEIGTACDQGHSQTSELAYAHGIEILKLNHAYAGESDNLVGELAHLVWKAFQDQSREKKHGTARNSESQS